MRGDLSKVAVDAFVNSGSGGLSPVFQDAEAYRESKQAEQYSKVALSVGAASTDDLDEVVSELTAEQNDLEVEARARPSSSPSRRPPPRSRPSRRRREYQERRQDAEAKLGQLIAEEEQRRAEEAYRKMLAEQEAAQQAEQAAQEQQQRGGRRATRASSRSARRRRRASRRHPDTELRARPATRRPADPDPPRPIRRRRRSRRRATGPSSLAGIAINAAKSQLGVPYRYAAAEPGVAFDCSGLTMWSWGRAGVGLPHQSAEQYAVTPHVSTSSAAPGDLLFYYSPISHVGIYLGGGQLIHAPNSGDVGEDRLGELGQRRRRRPSRLSEELPSQRRLVSTSSRSALARRERRWRRRAVPVRADPRWPVEPDVPRSPAPTVGASCCAARRSAACSRPLTTWPASTASSAPSARRTCRCPVTLGPVHRRVGQRCAVLRDVVRRRRGARLPGRRRAVAPGDAATRRGRRISSTSSPISTPSTSTTSVSAISPSARGTSSGSCGAGRGSGSSRRHATCRRSTRWRARLAERLPAQQGVSIAHGDYRLGNCLVDPVAGRVNAVLDWELCTLGDPLADVGYLGVQWTDPGSNAAVRTTIRRVSTDSPRTASSSSATQRAVAVDRRGIDYYVAFSSWRLAIISEGVYARYVAGVMGDAPDPTIVETFKQGGRRSRRGRPRRARRRARRPRPLTRACGSQRC